jgi:hypothetical protein
MLATLLSVLELVRAVKMPPVALVVVAEKAW